MKEMPCPCPCPDIRALWDSLVGRLKSDGTDDNSAKDESPEKEDRTFSGRYTVHTMSSMPSSPSTPDLNDNTLVYRALWPFEARAEEELSFHKGDMFRIIERCGEWWKAGKLDLHGGVTTTGFVPQNYLARGESVYAQPWYFGKLNRFETTNLLLAPGNGVGAFLVRQSEKDSVGCVLSVRVGLKLVRHFKVHEDEDGRFFVDQNHTFAGLTELVEHFRAHSLASIIQLTEASVRREPKPQDLSHATVDDWELPKDQFTLEQQLGTGYFADVHRGKWKGIVNVAIKILKNNDSLDHREFQMEVQILKRLRHRHLISLFAVCTASPPFYIITELMEKGNLLTFLRGQEGRGLDTLALADMATQVVDGMAYLEAQQSIHRDLAARNILVGEDYVCKVADFGLARIIKEPFYMTDDRKIPYKWSAPEAISHGRFSNKSDVWSFGILLYEIFTYGGAPYPTYSNHEVFRLISSGYRMPSPPKCPAHIYDIMLMCWCESPAERPNFSELKSILEDSSRYTEWPGEDCNDTLKPLEGSSQSEQSTENESPTESHQPLDDGGVIQ